jgi:hypothetical protein
MSVLVATTQFSEAYRAVTKDLESFLYGESLYRCHSNQSILDSSINTRRQNDSRYRIIASIVYELLYASNIPLSSIFQITDRSTLFKFSCEIVLSAQYTRVLHGILWGELNRDAPHGSVQSSRCGGVGHTLLHTNFRSLQCFFSM